MFIDGVERESCLIHLKDDVEFTTPDKVFIKAMIMDKANTVVAQHSHEYDHTSLLTSGSVRVWVDGESSIDYKAPYSIYIPAKTKHKFMSLEDNTAVYCIHNVAETGMVKIQEFNSVMEGA